MQADTKALHKVLQFRIINYVHDHSKQPTTEAIAQMLSTILYYKRFFPYYTFNLICGLDVNGVGAVYGYDAIGSFERVECGAQGSGQALVASLLDNQISHKNQKIIPSKERTLQETLNVLKDTFSSAGERDIYTGDSVQIAVITKDGVSMQQFELKKD